MIKVNSHEAKLNFSKIMILIANGKEIIITRSGQDFAKIIPVSKAASHDHKNQDKIKEDKNPALLLE